MKLHRSKVPFIARGPELASLNEAWADSVAGVPTVLMVSADAGVGKTRLLREFTEAADGRVLWRACLPMGDRGLPLSPIVEAFRDLPTEAGPGGELPPVLAPLLHSPENEAGIGTVSAGQVFQGVLEAIEAVAAVTPVSCAGCWSRWRGIRTTAVSISGRSRSRRWGSRSRP